MNDPEALEHLTARVDALEKRVHNLEHPSHIFAPAGSQTAGVTIGDAGLEEAGSLFPILGRAMMGIAGAYLLRAMAELNLVPRLGLSAVAIAYAIAWLAWAARPAAKRMAATIYAATSALILAPMLWELTLRYQAFSPVWAATVLGAFVAIAAFLTRNRCESPVVWVVDGAVAATALALALATRAMLPFLATLLLLLALDEYAATRQRRRLLRPFVALVADIATGILIFAYSGPASAHAGYPPLGAAALVALPCALFLVTGAGVTVRTMLLRQPIAVFDGMQCIVTFSMAASSVFVFTSASGVAALGAVCLVLSAVCTTVAFTLFAGNAQARNYRVFGLWGIALLLSGAWWCMPTGWRSTFLGLAAVAAAILAARLMRVMLDFEAVASLTAAVVASGLLVYIAETFAGTPHRAPAWEIYIVVCCAAVCYALAKQPGVEDWQRHVLRFIPALFASAAIAAFAAHGLVRLTAIAFQPEAAHVAFLRTLAICVVALALAFAGSRWERTEMMRIAYAALVFVAAKLVFEDLRHGRMAFIAASISLFAVTLIGVPRLCAFHRPTPLAHGKSR